MTKRQIDKIYCDVVKMLPESVLHKYLYEKLDNYTINDIDLFVNSICESTMIDEDFKDTLKHVWNKIKSTMSKPVDYIKKVLDKDRELIKKTEDNLKMMPREDIAAIYSAEFSDTNVIDDLVDMVSMLKDILLLRYKHIPWRTAISACILLAYMLLPYNITLGSGLIKYVGRNTMKAGAVAAKITSFLSRGSMLGTEMVKKVPNVNVWEFNFGETIQKINNGEYDPGLLKAVEPYLNCLDELAIVYVLWKWFRKDLKKYRMWLAAKLKAKDLMKEDKVEECDIVAAGTAGASDMVSGPKGMTTTDVLGKCDHKDHGFFDKDCFHIPKPLFKKPLKRTEKNGMITDAELDKETILAIHDIPESEMLKFVKTYDTKATGIVAVAYYPAAKKYFIKYTRSNGTKYILAEFDGKKFLDNPDFKEKKIWSGKDVKTMYKWNNTKVKIWVVWGYEK